MSADDDPTAVIRITPVEGVGWDAIVDHPDGSRTFVLNPSLQKPDGFKLTVPPAPGRGRRQRSGSLLDDVEEVANDGLVGWLSIVGFVLATMFANLALIELGMPARDMGTYLFGTTLVVLATWGVLSLYWAWSAPRP